LIVAVSKIVVVVAKRERCLIVHQLFSCSISIHQKTQKSKKRRDCHASHIPISAVPGHRAALSALKETNVAKKSETASRKHG
jgi:hypothetical protein